MRLAAVLVLLLAFPSFAQEKKKPLKKSQSVVMYVPAVRPLPSDVFEKHQRLTLEVEALTAMAGTERRDVSNREMWEVNRDLLNFNRYGHVGRKDPTDFKITGGKNGDGAGFRIVTSTVYNSLRMESRERVSRSLADVAFPVAKTVAEDLQPRGAFSFVVIVIGHGVKDFSHENEKPSGEALVLVSQLASCSEFASGKISEEQFVKESQVYLNKGDGLNRIEVALR